MSEQKLPPDGLLASTALAAVAEETAIAAPVVVPSDLPVDPNYSEPITLALYTKIAGDLSRMPDEELGNRDAQRGKLIAELLKRNSELELALLAFAQQGMVMSNAKMCLRAEGRADEPGGGHWISQVTSVHLSPSEGIFFRAIDVVGRARVQAHMMDLFHRVQEMRKLAAEKEAHVKAGGKLQ